MKESTLIGAPCADIRELDSERQSLVYNHHHELIAASDTIAAVRINPSAFPVSLELHQLTCSHR